MLIFLVEVGRRGACSSRGEDEEEEAGEAGGLEGPHRRRENGRRAVQGYQAEQDGPPGGLRGRGGGGRGRGRRQGGQDAAGRGQGGRGGRGGTKQARDYLSDR